MRTSIDALRVFGFGRFGELSLELGPGLNLLVGPNEAGKSTLFAFIRAVLYGFERRSSEARLEPRSGGAFGGELLLSTGTQQLLVTRLGNKRRADGELSVRAAEGGVALPESQLQAALGGVSRELFCQVFSLTLDQLRDFDALTEDSEVSDALFAAGAQGAQRVPATLSQLEALASSIWSERAQKRPLNLELSRLEELRARLAAGAQRPEVWLEAVRRRDRLLADELDLRAKVSLARERLGRAEHLLKALPAVREALLLRGAPPAAPLDPASLTRLQVLEPRRTELAGQAEVAAASAHTLQRQVEALTRATASRHHLEEAAVAISAWRGLASVARGLAGRELGLSERRQSIDQRAKRVLGRDVPGWLAELDVGPGRVAELQALRARELELGGERSRAAEAAQALAAELDRLGAARELLVRPTPPASSVELEAQSLAAQRVLERSRALEDAQGRERALEERRATFLPPAPPEAGLLTPGMAGLALLALWVLAVLTAAAAPRWAACGLLGAALALTFLGALVYRRARAQTRQLVERFEGRRGEHQRQLARWQEELATVALERERLEGALAQARHQARVGSAEEARALLASLALWRREAEEFERCGREGAQLGAALEALEMRRSEAGRRIASADARLDAVQGEVDAHTTPMGFPPGLRAQQAIDLLAEAARLQDEALGLAREEGACRADARVVRDAAATLLACAQGLGLPTSGALDVVAERLAGVLAADARERDELREASIRLEQARTALERATTERQALERQLTAELASTGARDLAELQQLLLADQQAQAQAERRRQLEVQVRLLCAASVEQLAAELEAAGPLEERLVELRGAVGALDEQLAQTSRSLGEVRERLLGLETETASAGLRAEDAAATGRIARLAQECAVPALAGALLQRARQRFEAQHQPRVVRRADALFARLTERRYTALQVDPGARTLGVRDAQGGSWSVGQLSRGTRELLLLAFRLAVVEDFGLTRAQLPLILDDVLVNVDPERASRLVQVLQELAQRHQIIALTCHAHVRALFEAAGAAITAVQQPTQLSLLAQ